MQKVAIVGAGVIGLSWARLFAEKGWSVEISDPRPDLQKIIDESFGGLPVRAAATLEAALDGADFVQEAGPERLDLKHELYATCAARTRPDVVLASSTSSLVPSAISEGNAAADRILVGHPFNPPQLIPLVEVVPGPATQQWAVDRATEVYAEIGKQPITLRKEIPAFVGNRLQKVFLDECVYLVQQGVISAGDLDELVKASLGLRWATVGPFESNHLGGGPGGMRHLVEHVGSQLTFDAGRPDPAKIGEVIDQVEAAYGTGQENYERLVARRDARTRAVSHALADEG